MQELTALIGIATALAIGAASPGPSFVMVARTAMSSSRSDGVFAALGMGAGGLLFAVASLMGLHGILLAVPSLYWVLKVAGGLYLAWLGVRIWRAAKSPFDVDESGAGRRASSPMKTFALGFATQASNPKTAIVYASVFAAFLPATASLGFNAGVAGLVFLIEAGWYATVALLLSSNGPRNTYLHYRKVIDRVAGGVMTGLGLKLVTSAGRS